MNDGVVMYREWWQRILQPGSMPCDFVGSTLDLDCLNYAIYEGLGLCSGDCYPEACVFAQVLCRLFGFTLVSSDRVTAEVIVRLEPDYDSFQVSCGARVRDSLGRSHPQFDKFDGLLLDLLGEILRQRYEAPASVRSFLTQNPIWSKTLEDHLVAPLEVLKEGAESSPRD